MRLARGKGVDGDRDDRVDRENGCTDSPHHHHHHHPTHPPPALHDTDPDHDTTYNHDSTSDTLLSDLLDSIEVRARARTGLTPQPDPAAADNGGAGVAFARRPVALGVSGWSGSEEELFGAEVCGERGVACAVPREPRKPVEETRNTEVSTHSSTAPKTSNTQENATTPILHDTDPRPPLQRFRAHKPLSVTDLTSPSWCELQYHFALSKFGRKPRTPAMSRGSAVHKELEEQVYVTVPVDTKTHEDGWGIRLWNCIQGLRTLRATGMTRELEVWGLLGGEVVNGVIDELGVVCPDLELEGVLEAEGGKGQKPGRRKEGGGGERESQTLTEFFATRRAEESEEASEEPTTTPAPAPPKTYITDIKTRNSPSLPGGSSLRPTHIQLMLYTHLLTRLAAAASSPSTSPIIPSHAIFARYRLDPTSPFSPTLISQLADPENVNLGPSDSHDSAPVSSETDAACELHAHNTLPRMWDLMMREYRATFPHGAASVGKVLRAEFRGAGDGEYMGARVFAYDEVGTERYVRGVMGWWRGERGARGVEIEEAWKCGVCEFGEGCGWRIERARVKRW